MFLLYGLILLPPPGGYVFILVCPLANSDSGRGGVASHNSRLINGGQQPSFLLSSTTTKVFSCKSITKHREAVAAK